MGCHTHRSVLIIIFSTRKVSQVLCSQEVVSLSLHTIAPMPDQQFHRTLVLTGWNLFESDDGVNLGAQVIDIDL